MAKGSSSKRREISPSSDQAGPSAKRAVQSHDWDKDDEELDLESRLFGAKRSKVTKKSIEEEKEEDELRDLDDDELFTFDAPFAQTFASDDSDLEDLEPQHSVIGKHRSGVVNDVEQGEEDDEEVDDEGDEEIVDDGGEDGAEGEDGEGGQGDSESVTIELPPDIIDLQSTPLKQLSKKERQRRCVWEDPADKAVKVDLDAEARLRKLATKKAGGGGVVDGVELQSRLRYQFEKLHPQPDWAKGRIQLGTPSLTSLLSTTASFIQPKSKKSGHNAPLPQGTIDIQRLRDVNFQNPTTGKLEAQGAGGGVVDVAWHPGKRVPVCVVAGGDRRVRFFNVDGHTNPSLMTIHMPSLPLQRATFHPTGSSILFTGPRPFYYTYDLASARCLRSSRNLFGSQPSPTSPNSLTRHAFSPDGTLLAVAGLRGNVSVLDWNNVGSGAVVAELKSGRGGSTVDMIWNATGTELMVLGGRGGCDVDVWNVRERRVVRKWTDERAWGGSIMRKASDSSKVAIGSSTGIVNLYQTSSLKADRPGLNATSIPHIKPEPIKSLEHLTTRIDSLAFHPAGETMVVASGEKKGALKMYHVPSATAFSNWPTQQTPLGRITSVGFSSGGEYLSVGNTKGQVLLFSIKHYANA
ncbi:WD40-repeat-containing domain protein [Naematelia encephala]|uniref:WD40-repeat-containing domain protein n=1 Tax=Naematelia encephala TaxID=71784 RepID=A0A1Y2BC33_9TREE|nr:WD40-repeat-containing domain protein [Naematelia encephala]